MAQERGTSVMFFEFAISRARSVEIAPKAL